MTYHQNTPCIFTVKKNTLDCTDHAIYKYIYTNIHLYKLFTFLSSLKCCYDNKNVINKQNKTTLYIWGISVL